MKAEASIINTAQTRCKQASELPTEEKPGIDQDQTDRQIGRNAELD